MQLSDIMTPDLVARFKDTGEVGDGTMDRLMDFFMTNGEMPYGTAKARTGDPYQWVEERLAEEYGQ